jgi:hypothetical protein
MDSRTREEKKLGWGGPTRKKRKKLVQEETQQSTAAIPDDASEGPQVTPDSAGITATEFGDSGNLKVTDMKPCGGTPGADGSGPMAEDILAAEARQRLHGLVTQLKESGVAVGEESVKVWLADNLAACL